MSPRTAGLLLALGLGGCSSTGVGNPAPASFQLSIIADDETEASLGGAADDLADAGASGKSDATAEGGAFVAANGEALPRAAIADALLVIGRVLFLPCDATDAGSVVLGPFVVDLVHGTTSPPIPAVTVPSHGFCGLDVPLAPAASPSWLEGRSVYFDGTRADGTPFRFYADVQATLRVRAAPGVSWGPGAQAVRAAFWALRPRQWLESAELSGLELTTLPDGSVTIDISCHSLLRRAIRARLAGSSTLYDDVNGDAAFDLGDRLVTLGYGLPDAD